MSFSLVLRHFKSSPEGSNVRPRRSTTSWRVCGPVADPVAGIHDRCLRMFPELLCWWDLHWHPSSPPLQTGSISSWFRKYLHHRCSLWGGGREVEGTEDLEQRQAWSFGEAGTAPLGSPLCQSLTPSRCRCWLSHHQPGWGGSGGGASPGLPSQECMGEGQVGPRTLG